MRKRAPGKAFRKGISLKQIIRLFPDNETAEQWFIAQRWPNGVCCPACGSMNVQAGCKHKTMPFRCREKDCGKKFSVKTDTIMEGSKIGYQDWIIATFQMLTSLKSVSSMKLHRDLGVTQKSAWFLTHRLRAALSQDGAMFHGPVEVDETYFGGKRRNMSNTTRKALAGTGRGPVGKTAVVGLKDRATKHVAARVVTATDAATLQGFVGEHTAPGATVYTDDATAYEGMAFTHATVKHSLSEYVKGDIHTNGIESLWSMLKRAHKGTFHKLSPKHLEPLRARVRRTPQRPRAGHHRADGSRRGRHGRQAAHLRTPDCVDRSGERGEEIKRLRDADLIA